MDILIDFLIAILFGIVEGITEWLPISSTGHMIILQSFLPLETANGSAFFNFFLVFIQLGAIVAVIVNFFQKLWPFGKKKSKEEKKAIWGLWLRILIASIPVGVFGLLFGDWLDAHLYNYLTVSITLIIYGVIFILIELSLRKKKEAMVARYHLNGMSSTVDESGDPYGIFRVHSVYSVSIQDAMLIGLVQALALIPGTSRSGVTICGALLIGLSRTCSSEFSFLLSIPAMVGGTLIKGIQVARTGVRFDGEEWGLLLVSFAVAGIVSFVCVRWLLKFLRTHTFISFGIYRIALGAVLLVLYACGLTATSVTVSDGSAYVSALMNERRGFLGEVRS